MPPRPIRPKDDASVAGDSTTGADSSSAKRRAVSSACVPCKKRKSKCDGNLPACSTCVAVYRTECTYDADSDHRRKGASRRDLHSSQQRSDALDVIVASLRALPEPDAVSLLQSLRSNANSELLAASLRTHPALLHGYSTQLLDPDGFPRSDPSSRVSGTPPKSSTISPSSPRTDGLPDASTSPGRSMWFRMHQDPELIDHLLRLYFAWIYPFHPFFSREHFLSDMRHGSMRNCSPLLVNAVVAFACHYSDRPLARADPYNPATAGECYFTEAKRMLDQVDGPSLCTTQALGVMSIREASQGRESNAYQYAGRCIRMALELELHRASEGGQPATPEAEIRKITFWSVFNLETLGSVGLGRLSQLPRSMADTEKWDATQDDEAQGWRPYEDTINSAPALVQASRPTLFLKCLSEVCEIASDMVNTFYAPRESFTSRKLAACFSEFQEWYRRLPESLRLDNTSLPHVLVLHMYYHACVLHLFRPYLKLDLRAANLHPRETCNHCANEISRLMDALRAMYGLRRVCLTMVSALLSASTIHLLNLPSDPAAAHLSRALHDLQAMSVNHPLASRCIDVIRSSAAKWNITLPEGAPAATPPGVSSRRARTSPSPAAFFASSIPSSDDASSKSASAFHESPFEAPDQQPRSAPSLMQLQDHFVGPPVPLGLSQTGMPFWTPFPRQGMHVAPDPGSFDFPPPTFQNWAALDMPPHPSEMQPRPQSAPGPVDDSSAGTTRDWHWQ